MMTTPSSKNVWVLRVLADSDLCCKENALPNDSYESVQHTIPDLWTTLGKRVDKDLTSETRPSFTVIGLGQISPFTYCKFLTLFSWLPELTSADALESTVAPKSSTGSHIVVFGMPPSWSYAVDVSKQNKENVVAGMANLSIADDGGSRTLTNSSNKPNGE